ncbi:MAG: aldose 1-epimerase family protein [Faecalibacterium sp.]|jgi:galactose mutarotase-like enzyme|nr:aldose 1-epimerase family protein [Faecalibacterium sp.]
MQATIHNEKLTLTVDSFGAEAVSLKNAAGEEMLWGAEKEVWKRHAPILFPWTGKLPGNAFTYKGKTYAGGQHGFARDLEHRLIKAGGDTIELALSAGEETKERFPFDFTLKSIFRLEGATVHHTLTVQNRGADPMPFGIGYHPAFVIPFDEKHTTEDYEFRFDRLESPMCLDSSPNGLLSGKCGYALGTNLHAIPLTDTLFANDSFCMTNLSGTKLGIYEKDTGRHITCDIAGYPYTLIWSAATPKVRFVCIEPWRSLPGVDGGAQDWEKRAAAAALAQGETYTTTLSTEFAR